MASLVSPGVSVNIIDESLFIPSQASTVPLIFVATADEKKQPDGTSNASGTFEHDVIRTVTSLTQSLQLYGVPTFLEDTSGNQFHGDCRNEYGLVGLNQHLGVASKAYVIRAKVNLNDDIESLRDLWDGKLIAASDSLESLVNAFISNYNLTNLLTPTDSGYKVTVTGAELKTLINQATTPTWNTFSFEDAEDHFLNDFASAPLLVFANGYDTTSTGTYIGVDAIIDDWVANDLGSTSGKEDEFTAAEAENLLLAAADDFKFTREFRDDSALGANDAVRRAAIKTALQASVASNTDIRSENFEYNLIICPGFPELTDDLLALAQDINEEAFVIGDTPMNVSPEELVNTWSVSVEKRSSNNVAYYYPHALVTNLDGKDILVPASVAALRCYSYSDSVSELWMAPAGTQRGLLSSVSDLGYVAGTLGTATEFVQTYLNQGQRDDMYKYFTNINPIVFFPGRGILVFGQKTSANVASALDRVNVSRLMKFIKRQLRKNTLGFVFEPNDEITRDSIKAVVDGFLGDLVIRRALLDFATVCDESNNTPQRIDQNELYVDVAVKPVKAAEFIIIPVRVVATGAQI